MANYGKNWNVAGTDYYASEPGFNDRIVSFNKKAESVRKRALWADSKANREAYGHDSGNFKWTPVHGTKSAPPWMAGLPTLEAA